MRGARISTYQCRICMKGPWETARFASYFQVNSAAESLSFHAAWPVTREGVLPCRVSSKMKIKLPSGPVLPILLLSLHGTASCLPVTTRCFNIVVQLVCGACQRALQSSNGEFSAGRQTDEWGRALLLGRLLSDRILPEAVFKGDLSNNLLSCMFQNVLPQPSAARDSTFWCSILQQNISKMPSHSVCKFDKFNHLSDEFTNYLSQ